MYLFNATVFEMKWAEVARKQRIIWTVQGGVWYHVSHISGKVGYVDTHKCLSKISILFLCLYNLTIII